MEDILAMPGLEWVFLALVAFVGVFTAGWTFAPRKRSGKVVAANQDKTMAILREADEQRATEAKRRQEDAEASDNVHKAVADLFK